MSTTWTDTCGKQVPYTSKWSHCPVCHETFGSHAIADAHRVGRYDDDRRCLTPAEMLSQTNTAGELLGWRLVRYGWGEAWHGRVDPRWQDGTDAGPTLAGHASEIPDAQSPDGLSTDPETPPTPQNAAQPLAHLAGREICAECPWRGCRHCQWQGGE